MASDGMLFPLRFTISALILLAAFAAAPCDQARAQVQGQAVITNTFANIRSGPGTKFRRLGRVNKGERFPVTDMRASWYRIMYKGGEGWVLGQLIRFEPAGPSPAQTQLLGSQVESLDRRIESLTGKVERLQQALQDKLEMTAPLSAGPAMIPKEKVRPMQVQAPSRKPADIGPAWAFVPGAPRLKLGQKVRGYTLLGATIGCAAAGVWAWNDYKSRQDDYRALVPTSPESEFTRLHARARSRLKLSEGLLYGAAGLYGLNIVDYFFFLPRTRMALTPGDAGTRINLSLLCEF